MLRTQEDLKAWCITLFIELTRKNQTFVFSNWDFYSGFTVDCKSSRLTYCLMKLNCWDDGTNFCKDFTFASQKSEKICKVKLTWQSSRQHRLISNKLAISDRNITFGMRNRRPASVPNIRLRHAKHTMHPATCDSIPHTPVVNTRVRTWKLAKYCKTLKVI